MSRANDELQLPQIEEFNEDERLFARVSVGVTRAGGAMYVGRLLECRVGRILDARFPKYGISPWDLRVDGDTQVEVKTGQNSFSLTNKNSKDVRVWVFVHKPDSDDKSPSYSYSVASSEQVCAIANKSISAEKLVHLFGRCEESDLIRAVADAATRPSAKNSREQFGHESSASETTLLDSLPNEIRSVVEDGIEKWESVDGSVRFTRKRIFFEAEILQFLRRFVRCGPEDKKISVIRKDDLEEWGVDPTLYDEYLKTLRSATPAVRDRCLNGKLWISFNEIAPSDVSLLFAAARDLLRRIRTLE